MVAMRGGLPVFCDLCGAVRRVVHVGPRLPGYEDLCVDCLRTWAIERGLDANRAGWIEALIVDVLSTREVVR